MLFGDGPKGNKFANPALANLDRKSTRLNSSHGYISYAVFCLKTKHENAGAHLVLHAVDPSRGPHTDTLDPRPPGRLDYQLARDQQLVTGARWLDVQVAREVLR